MTDAPATGLSGRGKLAVFGFVAALATTAAYVRLSPPGAVTPRQCQPALAVAAKLAPFATGEVGIFRPATVSEDLRDLAFTDAGGARVTLASFAGRAVLLNFWATWCVPCRAEMPALDRLEADRGGDDFTVVAVNLDVEAPLERQRQFLADVGATHLALYRDPSLSLTADLRRRGLVFGLPTTVLVDHNGCRLGTAEGGAAWDSADAKALIAVATAPLP